jgi:hypothetical protein
LKIRFLYFFFLSALIVQAQERSFPISNVGRQKFSGNLFLFGLQQNDKSLFLKVYSIQSALKVDSLVLEINGKKEEYLSLNSDTLHGFLNIYIQKVKSRTVKIVRINRKFSIHTIVESVDITRLNSISYFEKEIMYSGNDVYTVKAIATDTSGKQCYLNKYTLRSDKENFEYDSKWQFPFERKFISSAQIVMADKRRVYLFVSINNGPRKGQWYLKVDGAEGKLLKAQKINSKGDTASYMLHRVSVDSANKSHYLFGQKFSSDEYDPFTNKFNLTGKKQSKFFLSVIDSSMEVESKNEFQIPVLDIVTQANKQASGYLSKTTALKYVGGEGYKLELDIFKSVKGNSGCFRYSNSGSYNILEKDGVPQIQKSVIKPDLAIDQYYSDIYPNDVSGCLCTDSLSDAFTLLFKHRENEAKIGLKKDGGGNQIWLLKKNNQKKNSINLAILSPEKKVYTLRPLIELSKADSPFVEMITDKEFIIGRNPDDSKVQLQILPW